MADTLRQVFPWWKGRVTADRPIAERIAEGGASTRAQSPHGLVAGFQVKKTGSSASRADFDAVTIKVICKQTVLASGFTALLSVAFVSNAATFALPLFTMAVYDKAIPHQAYETLWALTGFLVVALGIDFVARLVRGRIERRLSAEISYSVAEHLVKSSVHAPLGAAPSTSSAAINGVQSVDAATQIVPQLLVGLLVDLPFVLILLSYVAIVGGSIVIAPAITIVCIGLSCALAYRHGRALNRESTRGSVSRNKLLEETIRKLRTVKVTTSEQSSLARISKATAESLVLSLQARQYTFSSSTLCVLAVQLNTAVALVIGVYAVGAAKLSVGELVASVMLASRGLAPVLGISSLLLRAGELSEGLRGANSVLNVHREVKATLPKLVLPAKDAMVSAENITLTYPGRTRPALTDVSLSVRFGERVAVVGGSGSGKSSLLDILSGLASPQAGRVLFSGTPVGHYPALQLRNRIAYMPQDCEVFDGTIHANLVQGCRNADHTRISEVLSTSGLDRIVDDLPAGMETLVGSHGGSLSGGQRQALCLARTLYRNSDVLLLDEPTTGLDVQGEAEVVRRLGAFVGTRTLIIATHRVQVLDLVDRIIWLDAGRVVADGAKSEILARLATRKE